MRSWKCLKKQVKSRRNKKGSRGKVRLKPDFASLNSGRSGGFAFGDAVFIKKVRILRRFTGSVAFAGGITYNYADEFWKK